MPEEKPTIDFVYSSVVSIKDIKKITVLTSENIWVKRHGNDEISAGNYFKIINKKVLVDIKKDQQLKWEMID